MPGFREHVRRGRVRQLNGVEWVYALDDCCDANAESRCSKNGTCIADTAVATGPQFNFLQRQTPARSLQRVLDLRDSVGVLSLLIRPEQIAMRSGRSGWSAASFFAYISSGGRSSEAGRNAP